MSRDRTMILSLIGENGVGGGGSEYVIVDDA